MTKQNVCRTSATCFSLMLLAAQVAGTVLAQQTKPAPPANPTGGAATSAPTAPKGAATAPAAVGPSGEAPAPTKSQNFPPDKVVLKVGDQQVTVADLDLVLRSLPMGARRTMTVQGNRALGEQYALMLALSQKAVSQHLDNSPDFQRQMAFDRLQWLAQAEYRNLSDEVKVTPEEIKQYYSTHPSEFEQVQIRQVNIRKRPAGAKGGTPGLTPEQAQARLDEIRKALAAGADPKKLVEQYKDEKAIYIDQQPRVFRHGQLPANLDQHAFQLKDGEFSNPVDNANVVYIMQVVKHVQPELKDVSTEIENKLRDQKTQTALNNVKSQASVWMDPQYFAPPASAPAGPQPPAANSPTKPPEVATPPQ